MSRYEDYREDVYRRQKGQFHFSVQEPSPASSPVQQREVEQPFRVMNPPVTPLTPVVGASSQGEGVLFRRNSPSRLAPLDRKSSSTSPKRSSKNCIPSLNNPYARRPSQTKTRSPLSGSSASGKSRQQGGSGRRNGTTSPAMREKDRLRLDTLMGMGTESYLRTLSLKNSSDGNRPTLKGREGRAKSNTQVLLGDIPETLVKRRYPTTKDEKLDAFWSPSSDHNMSQQWLNSYAHDAQFFTSRARWSNVKLMEAEDMSIGCFSPYPGSFLGAVVSQQLISEETKMAASVDSDCPDLVHTAVQHIMQGIYSDGPGAARVRSDYRNEDPLSKAEDAAENSGDGTGHLDNSKLITDRESELDRGTPVVLMKALLDVPTFSRRAQLLRDEKEHEHILLPEFAEALEQLQSQRKKEQDTMINTVKRYQLKVISKIFRRWHQAAKSGKKAVEMLSMFLRDAHDIKPRDVLKAWYHVAQTTKYHREIAFEKTAKQEMDKIQEELARIRQKTMDHMAKIDAAMREGDLLDLELKDALKKLHDPARQPPTLLKMLEGVNVAISLMGNICMHQQSGNAHETHRNDKGAARLTHVYNKTPFRFESEFSSPDRWPREAPDPDVEDGIRKWRPGRLKNDEFTHAFEPFKTVAGKHLVRWANHVLEQNHQDNTPGAGATASYEGGSLCIINPNVDLEDGKILAVLHRSTPGVRVGIEKHSAKLARGGGGGGAAAGSRPGSRAAAMKEAPPLAKLLDSYDNVHRAKCMLQEGRRFMRPPMARYVTCELLTGVKEPPSPEEIAAHEKRMARLAAREKESGIIVHVMSRYMGMRIHIHDTKSRVKFAMLAELMGRHPGGSLSPPMEFENRMLKLLEEATDIWHISRDGFGKLVEDTPVSQTDEFMIELAKSMGEQWSRSQDIAEWVAQGMFDCLYDRAEWMTWRNELTFVQWQSVCTTVLSRKVKTEEDVDDGSFTTIDPLQLMGSVFKKLKIHENPTEYERALAEIVKYCKSRIRDLKRIFQYYAAAEEGDANSMDHVEYWKFVRECKLQKDRRALPSVRVDLCFQAANMDYTLTGADRQASDDGELESVEWIEVMTRLCSWRYPKKPPCLDQRFYKMMQEEVLENACSVDIDVFRERLSGDKVQDCLKKHRKNIKAIYTVYAADDDSDDAVGQLDTMNCKELTSFCKEMKVRLMNLDFQIPCYLFLLTHTPSPPSPPSPSPPTP